MMKRIKIALYNQYIYIDNSYESDDYKAIVEFEPITLKYNPKHWDLETLSHECVHLTNQICKRCLLELADYNNDEWYAYLHAYIFNKIYRATKKDMILNLKKG